MALYSYQAYSKDGKKISGTLDAPSEAAVKGQLLKMGAYPISITRATEYSQSWWQKIGDMLAAPISLQDKILFTKQLAVLLRSGVPLLKALELLVEQFKGRMRSILITIKDGVKEGQSLAQNLSRYPKVFDTIYVQLVRAGEASGNLEMVLDRLVEYMEQREALIKKIKGALRTPLIQLAAVVLLVIGLLLFVIPQLAATVESMGGKLPGSTAFLMSIGDFIFSYYLVIIGGLIALVATFMYWRSTESGARMIDKIKLKLPMVGYFSRMGAIVQFCRTLGMLLAGGVNLSQALDIVVSIVDNRILATTLSQARERIIKEGRIAEYLQQTGIFPPIAIYLIKTGEETGKLDDMLLLVAQNYEADLSEYSENLTALLQPVMMAVVALVVGFVVVSMMGVMTAAQSGFN